eukprot:augustus_masked-scaffold_39-processed-gene-2.90-mRNA-1 protein AED:1.00 eAED:1.00 QI:0/0/0/0/1/1/3/0/421
MANSKEPATQLPNHGFRQPHKERKNSNVMMIKGGRVEEKARDITMMIYDHISKQYQKIEGLTDTGADMNVAPTHLISPFQIKEEKPRVIEEVQIFDGKRLPVTKDAGKEETKPLVPSEDSSLYFSAIPHNAEEIISDVNGLIRRLPPLDLIFVKGFRRQGNDLLQLFQDHSFKLADSYISYEKETTTFTEEPVLFIQSYQRYLLFRSTTRKLPPIHHLKFTDVSIDVNNHEDRLICILSNLIASANPSVEVGILPPAFNPTESFIKDERVNNHRVHAKKLEYLVLISNFIDNVPDKFNETGIGEGNIDLKEEEVTINSMIKDKCSQSTLTDTQKSDLEEVMLRNLPSWGIRQSKARMSELHPIEVTLTPGHPILRSGGYHLTRKEEDFLELKFAALEKAALVKRQKYPVWGHPVFVVPKKI